MEEESSGQLHQNSPRWHALSEGCEGQGVGSLTVWKVRENAVATLGKTVLAGNFAGVGHDHTSSGAVGCAKHDEPHTDDCTGPVTGPHGALA